MAEWAKKSVRKKEIPPGMSYQSLRKQGVSLAEILIAIDQNTKTREVSRDPITKDNCVERLALKWLQSIPTSSGHLKVLVECTKCSREEELDYGTLKRMYLRKDRLCRVCRGVGGKEKPVEVYNVFLGFEALSVQDSRVTYKCLTCKSNMDRTLAHICTAEYLVCSTCTSTSGSTKVVTDLGQFNSYFEYHTYKILLKYFIPSDIEREVSYDTLFSTGTKHRLDFWVKSVDLKLEVTTSNHKFNPQKYSETAEWKKSFGVLFAFTLKEVEDIVQSYMKV